MLTSIQHIDDTLRNISNETPRTLQQFQKDLAALPYISECKIMQRYSQLMGLRANLANTNNAPILFQQMTLEISFIHLLYPIRRNVFNPQLYAYYTYNYKNIEPLKHKIPVSDYYTILAKAIHQGLSMKSITELRNVI